MSLTIILETLQEINEGITGVTRAFTRPPETIETAHLPAIAVVLGTWGINEAPAMQDRRRVDHHLKLRVYGNPIGQELNHAARQADLEPFFERVLDAYDAAILLNEKDGSRYESKITGVRYGVATGYDILEFDLDIVEKYDVTFDT